MTTPYRSDQIGSLLRPPELLAARAEHAEGRLPREELRAIEDRAILDVLERQRQIGIGVLADGELRREDFMGDMVEAVEGFAPPPAEPRGMEWREGAAGNWQGVIVAGRLRQTRRLTAEESAFLRAHAPGPFKITLPSATQFGRNRYRPGITDRFYATPADLLRDLVGIVRGEIAALVQEGVSYIQLDAPTYTTYLDPRRMERMRQGGVDTAKALEEMIAADSACLEGVPRDGVILAIHLCRGNNRSSWLSEGGYDPIAERVFGALNYDAFLLEYDSARAGGFEPLRFVPRGKTVVLGLVTTKSGALEPQDDLLRRIEEASKYVPIDNLALSPQCGFASNSLGNLLSIDDQWRKLELVVDTARKVWG
jgi:5-methyltetrahydropteroyltriglutamate--homocysteine methyltransferase